MTEGPEGFQVVITPPESIPTILDRFTLSEQDHADLLRQLRDREDGLMEAMQMVGSVYGMYSQIVAFWMMRVGLGTPREPEVVAEITRQFEQLMVDRPWENPTSGT